MDTTIKTYKTSDLHLSAFLKARWMHFKNKQIEGGSRCVFVFEDRKDRNQLIEEYFKDGIISIRAFRAALQDLKTLVHNV